MHKIIQGYLCGELKKSELIGYYLTNFREEVPGNAPNRKVYSNYLKQGTDYLTNITFPYTEVAEVEKKVEFELSGIPFVGFIDIVANDNGVILADNKSRILKPRSKGKKITQADRLLDNYLRQLYLYSIPISDSHGCPVRLDFNCFRANQFIHEPYIQSELNATKAWALERIAEITQTDIWKPNLEYFRCSYLCDVSHHCEYFALFRGSG